MSAKPFRDRRDGGQALAARLGHYAGRDDTVVLALPRGGVPVAHEVARALAAPLDVFVVRKLGVPGQEELALGAVASGGVRVINRSVVNAVGVPAETIERLTRRERGELARRERAYRDARPPVDVRGRVVLLVDDGLATGASMRVAVAALREQGAARLVIAVPAAPAETCRELATEVDEVVCATSPEPFTAVGSCYDDFSQTTDEDVRELLGVAAPDAGPAGGSEKAER